MKKEHTICDICNTIISEENYNRPNIFYSNSTFSVYLNDGIDVCENCQEFYKIKFSEASKIF